MVTAYTGNLYVDESMVETLKSNDFPTLLSEVLNRLQIDEDLTHGFIRHTNTGKIKTTCRKVSK